MISRAIARFIRISPRKSRLVANMVRGKSINEAQAILMNLEQKPRHLIKQVLLSAVANAAKTNPDVTPVDLYVSKITIDGGPVFKRYRAGSMGRAMMIKHRTSHVLIELDRKKPAPVKTPEGSKLKAGSEKTTEKIQQKTSKTRAKKLAAHKKGA